MRNTAILTIIAAAALSGCATMRDGAFDKVEIATNPPGAHCKMYREGEGFLKAIATPGAKYIRRSDKPLTIRCSKDGYKTAVITAAPDEVVNSQGAIANFVTLGAGFFVDAANKTRYDFPRYEINLEKL